MERVFDRHVNQQFTIQLGNSGLQAELLVCVPLSHYLVLKENLCAARSLRLFWP